MKKMKKIVVLLVLVVLVLTPYSYGQRTKLYSGDKSAKEIKKSTKIFLKQIENYQAQIKELRQDNKKLAICFQRSKQASLLSMYSQMIERNDSLIGFYQDKIQESTAQLSEFVSRSSGKDEQRFVDVRRVSPDELANLICVTSYYDNSQKQSVRSDSAAVANFLYHRVRADVYFSDRKIYTFFLGPTWNFSKPSFICFKIPGPGEYRVEFTDLESGNFERTGRFVDCIGRASIGGKDFAFVANTMPKK